MITSFQVCQQGGECPDCCCGCFAFSGGFHLIDMRSTAVSVVLCAIMVMMAVAVACAIVADIQVKRKKSIGDGEDSDESNPSVDT